MNHEQIKAAALRAYGRGHHTVGSCPVCGNNKWLSCCLNQPDDVTIVKQESNADCPRCAFMFQRHPEVASWVLDVVAVANGAAQPTETMKGDQP